MIKLFLNCMKLAIIATVVLVTSQIQVGEKRICDHVRDITHSGAVQRPIHWIAEKFAFIEGHGTSKADHAEPSRLRKSGFSRAAGSEHAESERERLSGLLKHPGH